MVSLLCEKNFGEYILICISYNARHLLKMRLTMTVEHKSMKNLTTRHLQISRSNLQVYAEIFCQENFGQG